MKFYFSICALIFILSQTTSLPLEADSNLSVIDQHEQSDLMNKLNRLCISLASSNVWYSLNENFMKGCLQIIANRMEETDFEAFRNKRFFSVGNGHLNKHASTGSKGFKYGK